MFFLIFYNFYVFFDSKCYNLFYFCEIKSVIPDTHIFIMSSPTSSPQDQAPRDLARLQKGQPVAFDWDRRWLKGH